MFIGFFRNSFVALFLCFSLFAQDLGDLEKLHQKGKLKPAHIQKLASLCLEISGWCDPKMIFSIVSPNFMLSDGLSFAHALYKKKLALANGSISSPGTSHEVGIRNLFDGAFSDARLDPHIKTKETAVDLASDLALEILLSGDTALKNALLKLQKFDPNSKYGSVLRPLVSVLLLKEDFKLVRTIMKHDRFVKETTSGSGSSFGSYLLRTICPDDDNEELISLFNDFMGGEKKKDKWRLYHLRLDMEASLNGLMNTVLDNDEDRLTIFNLMVEQLLLYREDPNDAISPKNYVRTLVEFLNSKASDKFRRLAIQRLINYQVVSFQELRGIDAHIDFWFVDDSRKELDEFSMREVTEAQSKHVEHEADDKKCGICWENSGETRFRTGPGCKHCYCQSCWISVIATSSDEEVLTCPGKGCKNIVPPSLLLALSPTAVFYAGQQESVLSSLEQKYARAVAFEQKKQAQLLNGLPNSFQCPQCKKFVILTPRDEIRKLKLPCCGQKFAMVPGDSSSALPMSAFIRLGKCSECGNFVDKIAGCDSIRCMFCKQQTRWKEL